MVTIVKITMARQFQQEPTTNGRKEDLENIILNYSRYSFLSGAIVIQTARNLFILCNTAVFFFFAGSSSIVTGETKSFFSFAKSVGKDLESNPYTKVICDCHYL